MPTRAEDPRAYARRYKARRRLELTAKAKALGKTPGECEWCGKQGKTQYHHRDPSTKVFELSQWCLGRKTSETELVAELEKCACVCKSCHRYHHTVAGQGSVFQQRGESTYKVTMSFPTREIAEEAQQLLVAFKATHAVTAAEK